MRKRTGSERWQRPGRDRRWLLGLLLPVFLFSACGDDGEVNANFTGGSGDIENESPGSSASGEISEGLVEGPTGAREIVQASGILATASRQVRGFDEILVKVPGEVIVDVNGKESLEIETDDNVLDLLTTEVRGGRLELGVRPGVRITGVKKIVFRITAANLTGVDVSGSANFIARGVDAQAFDVSISGAGSVEVAGKSDDLVLNISGTGNFAGKNFAARKGLVKISGAGEAVVNAAKELDISISGVGNVRYLGNPIVHRSVRGVGSISRW